MSVPFTLRQGALHIVPVCHDRLEFAHEVRRAILSVRPAAVAVELHDEVREAFIEAVKRLPRITVVEQRSRENAHALWLQVEPTDPYAEAVRTSLDAGIEVHFVDLNVPDYPQLFEPMPDSYALYHVGLGQYYEEYRKATTAETSDGELAPTERPSSLRNANMVDDIRERHMAWQLQRLLDAGGNVILVCGIRHALRVHPHLADGTGRSGEVAPAVEEIKLLNPNLDVIRAASGEMPFLMAAYEFDRKGPGPDETWLEKKDATPPPPPPPTKLEELTRDDIMEGLHALLGMGPKTPQRQIVLTPQLLRALSRRLGVMHDPRSLLGLLGGNPAHIPRLPSAPGAGPRQHEIFKFRDIDDRRPQLRQIYAEMSRLRSPSTGMLDRQRVSVRMLKEAARFYEENTGEKFKRWQLRTLLQFIRNWCHIRGMLLPRGWWDWSVAARGVADDNYAFEVWDLASFYPWTDDDGSMQGLDLEAFESNLRAIRFRRRWPRFREAFRKPPVRPRKQQQPGEDWSESFDDGTICSYPPEDIVIEDYGRYLKKKAMLVLSDERTRVEPFTTSLLDGIDVRETIRNWPRSGEGEGTRIYVREHQRVKGGAGAVVVIFDDDLQDDRYPWKMTWHGEHEQESDMAFYATPIYAKIVGPGIARCEYGGLMLTYPPRRVMDVWSDPFYSEAQTKSEVLLLAAIEYSVEKHVVYVAAKPPRSLFRSRASRIGKKIVYLPIGQLSPVSIKKLRVFHVLSGHHVRDFAKDYVW